MSTAAVTVMEFTDRIFLSNYSLDAISAVTPSGIVVFLLLAFFSGVATYGSVFIAQYTGAGTDHQVGVALWQAIYFALGAGIVLIGLSLLAVPIFKVGGHPPEIQRLEAIYFKIMCMGAVLHVLNAGLASFFTGRGETRPVMLINTAGMLFNIPLDYALINGLWGFPELGISGAALATVASWGLILILFALFIFTKANEKRYHVRQANAFNREIFSRLMIFGIPGAFQFCVDVFAFMFFIFMVGRIGKMELAASNIVMSINSLAFMSAMGFSQGVSTLVGQALGRGAPLQAKKAVWRAIHLLMFYTLLVDLLYLFAPEWIISFFIPSGPSDQIYASVVETSCHLLRIVAIYIFMDALYMTFAGALRGAGDTHFIMWSIGVASLVVLILPVFIGIEYLQMGIFHAWSCIILFIASMFFLTAWRYRQGKWQKMLVVERERSGV